MSADGTPGPAPVSPSAAARPAPAPGLAALLPAVQAWLAGPQAQADPVRRQAVQALARRTADASGRLQALLAARLAAWLPGGAVEGRDEGTHRAPSQAPNEAPNQVPNQALPARSPSPVVSPLAELLVALNAQVPAPPGLAAGGAGGAASEAAGAGRQAPRPPSGELKALQAFRGSWTRLHAERHLHLARASVPDNAGPLNTQGLVLRALQAMQDLSPAVLDHFVVHVEALMWLEQASGGAFATPRDVLGRAPAPPAAGRRRAAR